jgi:hypothetical protein
VFAVYCLAQFCPVSCVARGVLPPLRQRAVSGTAVGEHSGSVAGTLLDAHNNLGDWLPYPGWLGSSMKETTHRIQLHAHFVLINPLAPVFPCPMGGLGLSATS